MKYLFFDIECADGGKATICSFGYVIADENFKILRREDIVINPQGRFYLTGRAGRPDVHLAYPEATFKRAPTFDKFYNKIKALVENKEYYVVGHSIGDDVTYLNKACARYKLEPFCFSYFDTQRMYRELTGDKKSISLENALAAFEIDEKFRYHQSVEDARATMFLLKALLAKANASFEDYWTSTDRCTGKTENGKSEWDYTPPMTEGRHLRECGLRGEKGDNVMLRGRKNHTLFLRYLDFGEAIGEKNNKLAGKKISISMNYETEHFKDMVRLAGLIKAAGGEYVLKASSVDIFATFECLDEDGNPRRCSRGEYVRDETENGRDIQIITLDELLKLIGTSLEELKNAEPIDVEYLAANRYKR